MENTTITACGTIVHGNHIGTRIGIPTINIFPETQFSDLKRGVYFSTVSFLSGAHTGNTYYGITNVGCKPTVQDSNLINFETHIFDFSDDVYGETARVSLVKFSRPEMKFNSIDELTAQIRQDINDGKKYFGK